MYTHNYYTLVTLKDFDRNPRKKITVYRVRRHRRQRIIKRGPRIDNLPKQRGDNAKSDQSGSAAFKSLLMNSIHALAA